MRRVVVTGLGLLSPLGSNLNHSWDNLISLKSGITKTNIDVSDISSKISAQIKRGDNPGEFNPDNILSLKEQRKLSNFIIYGIDASIQAVKDAGLDNITDEKLLNRIGIIIGSGIGGLDEIYNNSLLLNDKGPRRISPFFIPASLINLVSGHVSIKYGFAGPNHSVVTACATGTHAIGDASRIIKYGDADIMVAGGSEAAITRIGLAGFASARALSTNFNETPELASRPWDNDRDGFVMGEGSGIIILEEYEHAKKRGAKIYGEIIGYGMSGDAYHITSPAENGSGAYRAMEAAIKDAKINIDEVDYVNAHGTSTPLGDKIELATVARLLSNRKDNFSMSSTKSSIGHLLGAAGAVEAIFSIKALNDNVRPATLNLNNSIDNLGINLQPNQILESKTDIVISNSFGFGGTNASLVFRKI